MNKVIVEYRNKEELDFLSRHASDPVEAIVTVCAPSINSNGETDLIEKSYHLYVGEVIDIGVIEKQSILSETEIGHLREKNIRNLVKNENGVRQLQLGDSVFENSQKKLMRVNVMLAKLDNLGYETPDVLRKSTTR